MEKINIAELLKDCPKGMELYSPIFGKVYLDKIRPHLAIVVTTDEELKEEFLYDGRYGMNGECMLFPSKGKTTWKGFHRPFTDGDIIYVKDEYSDATFTYVAIFKQIEKGGKIQSHCFYNFEDDYFSTNDFLFDGHNTRFATEEEKEKLFKAIKDNGCRWDEETKTLEKLAEPKFKVGDRIRQKGEIATYTITDVNDAHYFCGKYVICDTCDDNWELVSNKFDITTLKPFESKVLVRNDENQRWLPAFWGYKVVDGFITTFGWCKYCIPYKGNEILFKTNNDCDDFYKTWEE